MFTQAIRRQVSISRAGISNATRRCFSAAEDVPLPSQYLLNNGTNIPSIGLGTAGIMKKEPLVPAFMEAGYKLVDTASWNKNEGAVGDAIEVSMQNGKKRDDFYVMTKLWHTDYKDVEGAMKKSLEKLKLDHVDMFLVHWPASYVSKKPLHVLWPEMEALVEKGLTKSIGVSSFNTQLLWDLLSYAKIPPAVNQIELNPQCVQPELVRFCLSKNIRPVGFSPLGLPGSKTGSHNRQFSAKDWPDLRQNFYINYLARKYYKSESQIMLNWGLCKGHCVIPKSATLDHQKDNLDIFDFRLTEKEIADIDKIDEQIRGCNKLPFFEGFSSFA